MEIPVSELEERLEKLFDEMVGQQQRKVLETARSRLPALTADDILNPHDYPQLLNDPVFNYEEGLAAGLMAAQMAVRARLLRPLRGDGSSQSKEAGSGGKQ